MFYDINLEFKCQTTPDLEECRSDNENEAIVAISNVNVTVDTTTLISLLWLKMNHNLSRAIYMGLTYRSTFDWPKISYHSSSRKMIITSTDLIDIQLLGESTEPISDEDITWPCRMYEIYDEAYAQYSLFVRALRSFLPTDVRLYVYNTLLSTLR